MNLSLLGAEDPMSVELPLELWRVVFSYLPVTELCKCCQVCKAWNQIVCSLDSTVWKNHFMNVKEWRHPHWPRFHSEDSICWKRVYREHHLNARLWTSLIHQADHTHCITFINRRKERKIITVGKGCDHDTLKSALSVASEYDRILISPGIYDEQFEMSSKIPFELMGRGELGSVVLVMCVEQNAMTGRLCNLVIKAPWFTGHVVKIMNGHLQVDNCILEDGEIVVHNPGTCHFRYCSFRRLQMTLTSIPISVIENCEFISCDTVAIKVEGYPSDDTNWAHGHMREMTDPAHFKSNISRDQQSATDVSSDGKNQSSFISDLNLNSDVDSIGVASIAGSQASLQESRSGLPGIGQLSLPRGSQVSLARTASSYDTSTLMSESTLNDRQSPTSSVDSRERAREEAIVTAALAESDSEISSASSDVNVHLTGSRGQISSLWSDDEEFYVDEGLQTSLKTALSSDRSLLGMVKEVSGCVIRHCKLFQCQGGIAVSRQGQVRIEHSEFNDVQYGIRCLQNAKVAILENEIHHCQTSGIFMRLAAHGLIAGNDVYCTSEAGIDIRKNADPVVQCNKVHHSKRSGIVVLGSGCGTIKANDIYQNREAGIYVLYRGNPYISGNRIVHGGAAGIAINEDGRGYIVDNLISGNRWGGIDIRHGSDPRVSRNLVCNGLADGIVIGQKGRGVIEGNTIKGNVGCGVWVMGGQPLIQVNQIYNNNDTGVSFVQNKESEEDYSADEADDSTSEQSLDLQNVLSPGDAPNDDMSNSINSTCPYPQLKFNTIYHNNGYGVLAQCAEQIYMSGNALHANRNIGMLIKQALLVTVINNSITGNEGTGVQITSDGKAKLEGNGIYDNHGHGIHAQGEASIASNDIFSNKQCALLLDGCIDVKLEKNRIHSPQDFAIRVETDSKGSATENKLYSGTKALVHQEDSPSFSINDNETIHDNKGVEHVSEAGKDWHLEDPPPRPHVEPPPTIVPKTPNRRVTTVTRVVVPYAGSCDGSKMCIIV